MINSDKVINFDVYMVFVSIVITHKESSHEIFFQLAVRHGVKFFETSALSGVNVEEAFMTMAGDIKKKTEKKLVRVILHFHS